MRDTPVPKAALDRATRFKIYDPDTGYDGTASLEDFGLVTATTGPGGGVEYPSTYPSNIDFVGAGGTPRGVGRATQEKHEYLKAAIRRAKGGRVATAGVSPISFRADHGTQWFFDSHFSLFEERNIPVTLGILTEPVGDPSHRYEPCSYTWPQIQAFHHRGCEMWPHTHSHTDPTLTAISEGRTVDEVLWRETVLPGIIMMQNGITPIGFQAAGITPCLTPSWGSEMFVPEAWDTNQGKWILENYGLVELAQYAKDRLGNFYTTGGKYRYLPTNGASDLGHYTLDSVTIAQAKIFLDQAIAWGVGAQIMWHPKVVAGGLSRFTTANLIELLDYVVTLRDAGQLVCLSSSGLHFADMDATNRRSIMKERYFSRGVVPGGTESAWARGGNTATPLSIAQDGTTGRYIVTQPAGASGYIYQGNSQATDHLWHGHMFSAEVQCRNTGQTVSSKMRISVYIDDVLIPGVNRLQTIADDAQWKTIRQSFCVPIGAQNIQVRIDRPIGDGVIEYRDFGVFPI